LKSLQTFRDFVESFLTDQSLKMFGLDGRLIESLASLHPVELIGDERKMSVELMIRCVLEE